MKKISKIPLYLIFIVSIFTILFVCLLTFSIQANAITNSNDKIYGETLNQRGMAVKDCPSVTAKYACIMSKDGEMIYERNAYDSAKIASLTKIMTAIIALENFNLDEEVEINKRAVEIGESSAGFWVGDKLDMRSALYAMMVPSGNDAAEAICEVVGKKFVDEKDDRIRNKSEEEVKQEAKDREISEDEVEDVFITDNDKAFCKLMNDKASEIGCTNTFFTNPHGLDNDEFASNDQRSCAFDIATITKYAMQNDLFRKIVGGGSTSINVSRNGEIIPLELNTTDILIGNFEGCIGVKTGNTDIAGACFSGACVDATDGTEFYTVVLKSEDETQRFIDTQDLFNWYLTNKISFRPAKDTSEKDTMIVDGQNKEVGVVARVSHNCWVDCQIPVTTENQDLSVPVLAVAGNVHLKLEPIDAGASYKAGDKVCELVLTQHNKEISRIPLIAIKDAPAPNIFQMLGVGIDRLFKSIGGEQTVANSDIVVNCDRINKVTDKS